MNPTITKILEEHDKKNRRPDAGVSLFLSFVAFCLSIPASLLRGLAINLYWGWFLAAIINVPAPGVVVCMALHWMFALLKGVGGYKNMEELEQLKNGDPAENFTVSAANLVYSVAFSVSSIFFGWILHLLIS